MQPVRIGKNFRGELSPEARAIVEKLDDPHTPPVQEMDLTEARTSHALEAYDVAFISDGITVTERILNTENGEINCRIYTPTEGENFPMLVFAHGGCWTFCGLDSHDRICRYLTKLVKCMTISVDYKLAPENPFPAGLNDYCAVISWCLQNASEIMGDSSRIALAGDSAGGNLATVAAQRFQGDSRIRHQLLFYPICELDNRDLKNGQISSMDKYAKGYFFTKEVLEWTGARYSAQTPSSHPEISPLRAPLTQALAPATLILAECDPLHDQGLRYSENLSHAGVSVKTYTFLGMPHAFIAMAGTLELGKEALELCVKKLTAAL